MFSKEFPATRRGNKTGMLQLTLTNLSELYPDVLNSVNRNASNEISQSTYMKLFPNQDGVQ